MTPNEQAVIQQITHLERAIDKLAAFNRQRKGQVHLRQEEAIELWRYIESFLKKAP